VKPLGDVRLYLVAPAHLAAAPLADLIPDLAAAGVDMVQLREKEAEALEVIRLAEPVAAACGDTGIPFVVNDRPDVALALGCGVHLGQRDLPVRWARRILPDAIVGRSTHAPEEIDAEVARRDEISYIAVGPVHATATKPGRRATGLALVEQAAAAVPPDLPWFAIGGMNEETLPQAIASGARRAVVVRAITQAADPPAAAARLAALLRSSSD
jgi:thiamine-phosphate pyrophosphorylase